MTNHIESIEVKEFIKSIEVKKCVKILDDNNTEVKEKPILDINSNFKKFNLIYGYNGSGKTTFSRFFEYINSGIEEDLEKEGYKNYKINGKGNFQDYKNRILVYNSDYVEKVLSGNQKQFLLVEGAEEYEEKIKSIDDAEEYIEKLDKRNNQKFDLKWDILRICPRFDNKLTEKASDIRNTYKITSIGDFDIRQIKKYIKELKQCEYQELSKGKREEYKSHIQGKPKVEWKFEEVLTEEELEKDINETNEVLKRETLKSENIEEKLSKWIAYGFENFHKGEEDNKKCKFCRQDIDENIIKSIKARAEDEYQKLIKEIDSKISKIDKIEASYRSKLNNLLNFIEEDEDSVSKKYSIKLMETPNNLSNDKKEQYIREQESLSKKLNCFFDELEKYKNDYLSKKKQSPEKDCSYKGDDLLNLLKNCDEVNEIYKNIIEIIKKDNEEKEKANSKEAKEKLIKDDVYKFINNQSYSNQIKLFNDEIKKEISKINDNIDNLKEEILKEGGQKFDDIINLIDIIDSIEKLKFNQYTIDKHTTEMPLNFKEINTEPVFKEIGEKIKNERKKIENGREKIKEEMRSKSFDIEKINKNIELIIGNKGFYIEKYKEGKIESEFQYRIKRDKNDTEEDNNKRLKKFSEGEKTAICLAFYLTKLQDISENISEKVIVVIDDPICSLDQNIIYNIYSQIVHSLTSESKILQAFVMTHNYYFAYLMSNYFDKYKQNDTGFGYLKKGYFQATGKFESEYELLCRFLREYRDKSENDLFIGNVLRRVWEKICRFKFKGKKGKMNMTEIKEYTVKKIKNNKNTADKENHIIAYVEKLYRFCNDESHQVKDFDNDYAAIDGKILIDNFREMIECIDAEHYEAYFK